MADDIHRGSRNFDSIDTERSVTKSEPVYNVKYWGAEGDGTTNDRQAIKDAANEANNNGGTVYFPPGTYGVDGGGSTPDGVDVGITLPGNVDYRLDEGATIKNLSTPQHCIFFDGADTWTFKGGQVDGASHDSSQTDTTRAHAIAVGYKTPQGTSPDTTTGCTDWEIANTRITGGHRHGIETAGGSERGEINGCRFDDAAADDCVSISGVSEWIQVNNCWSFNRSRSIFTASGFEIDDGPRYIWFNNCVSWSPPDHGFDVMKTHANVERSTDHNHLNNCVAYQATNGAGFFLNPGDSKTHTDCELTNCYAYECSNGIRFGANGGTLRDVRILGGAAYDSNQSGIQVAGGETLKDVEIRGFTVRNTTNRAGIWVNPDSSSTYENIVVTRCSVSDSSNAGIQFDDPTGAYTEWTVEQNDFENNGFGGIAFSSTTTRQNVRTLRNQDEFDNDPSTEVPANPYQGMEYLDDGSNRGDSNVGYRYYNGTSWVDY